jgi:hypothetical protein
MAYTTDYAEKSAPLQIVPSREFDDLVKIGGRIEAAAEKLETILRRFRPESDESAGYPTGAVGYVGELSNCRAHLCRLENLIGELDRIA